MRREGGGKCTYSMSNASPNTHLKRLAWLKCQRYFVERTNQDAKSELGWDELEAQQYLAWMHHLALTILALWFITRTKIKWAEQYARDPSLLQQFEVDVLPALSTANERQTQGSLSGQRKHKASELTGRVAWAIYGVLSYIVYSQVLCTMNGCPRTQNSFQ